MANFLLKMQIKTSFRNIYRTKKNNICIDGFDPGYVGVGYLKSTTNTIVLLTLASPPSHRGGRQRKKIFFTHTKPLCVHLVGQNPGLLFHTKHKFPTEMLGWLTTSAFPYTYTSFLAAAADTKSLCPFVSLSFKGKGIFFLLSKCA